MADPSELPLLERELLAQLSQLEQRISELNSERRALERFIMRVRHENVASKEVTRKNSFDRILVEQKILSTLKHAPKPLSNQQLFREAQAANYKLKSGTFRSHLNRLKERGLIEHARHGYWRSAGSARKPTSPQT